MDGVVNVLSLSADTEGDRGWAQVFTVTTGDGRGPFRIRIASDTREWLEVLSREFDVVWATTWMDEAAKLLSPRLGLGHDWPVVEMGEEIRRAREGLEVTPTWKLPAVERWAAASGRPLAWIDDDLGPDAAEWAERRTRAVAPTLLVQTDPFEGLREQHAIGLLAWARALNDVGAG